MNLNHNPTADQLRDLLRPCDDRAAHHVLWVDRAGDVHLTPLERRWPVPEPGPDVLANALVRFETFQSGNDFVGPDAAADDEWVATALDRLQRDWAAGGRDTPVLIRV